MTLLIVMELSRFCFASPSDLKVSESFENVTFPALRQKALRLH